MFRTQIGFASNPSPVLTKQTDKEFTLQAGNTLVYVYALCYVMGSFRDRHYPLLMPFYGTTSRDGLKVAGFSKFILPGKEPGYNDQHPHRIHLNELSKTMYEAIKPLTSKRATRNQQVWTDTKQTIFELWQEALPLLKDYPYNRSYYLYWLNYLSGRPKKAYLRDCRYSQERPSLIFLPLFR